MLFDKLCGIAERHMPPKFSDILKKMHLFQFDEKTEEILSRLKWNREQEQFLRDNFFLPFQYVAIEDPASCVLFWDDSPDVHGLEPYRHYIEIMSCNPKDPKAFRDGFKYEHLKEDQEDLSNAFIISGGIMRVNFREANDGSDRTVRSPDGYLHFCFAADEKKVVYSVSPENFHLFTSSLENASAAFEEIVYVNSPDRFILEKGPIKQKTSKAKIPRSNQRPIYTLVTPKEIRERYNLAEPTGRKVSVHERRKHIRHFRSEVFTKMKGKTKIIPATWVGKSEGIIGKHYWKVLLDK